MEHNRNSFVTIGKSKDSVYFLDKNKIPDYHQFKKKILYNKHGDYKSNERFNYLQIECLIYNKNCRLTSEYKEKLLLNDEEEFLKRFYSNEETKDRIPLLSNYYKNYIIFFCLPFFKEFKVNLVVQSHANRKAELYYKTISHKIKHCEDRDSDSEVDFSCNDSQARNEAYGSQNTSIKRNKVDFILFDTIVRNNIDKSKSHRNIDNECPSFSNSEISKNFRKLKELENLENENNITKSKFIFTEQLSVNNNRVSLRSYSNKDDSFINLIKHLNNHIQIETRNNIIDPNKNIQNGENYFMKMKFSQKEFQPIRNNKFEIFYENYKNQSRNKGMIPLLTIKNSILQFIKNKKLTNQKFSKNTNRNSPVTITKIRNHIKPYPVIIFETINLFDQSNNINNNFNNNKVDNFHTNKSQSVSKIKTLNSNGNLRDNNYRETSKSYIVEKNKTKYNMNSSKDNLNKINLLNFKPPLNLNKSGLNKLLVTKIKEFNTNKPNKNTINPVFKISRYVNSIPQSKKKVSDNLEHILRTYDISNKNSLTNRNKSNASHSTRNENNNLFNTKVKKSFIKPYAKPLEYDDKTTKLPKFLNTTRNINVKQACKPIHIQNTCYDNLSNIKDPSRSRRNVNCKDKIHNNHKGSTIISTCRDKNKFCIENYASASALINLNNYFLKNSRNKIHSIYKISSNPPDCYEKQVTSQDTNIYACSLKTNVNFKESKLQEPSSKKIQNSNHKQKLNLPISNTNELFKEKIKIILQNLLKNQKLSCYNSNHNSRNIKITQKKNKHVDHLLEASSKNKTKINFKEDKRADDLTITYNFCRSVENFHSNSYNIINNNNNNYLTHRNTVNRLKKDNNKINNFNTGNIDKNYLKISNNARLIRTNNTPLQYKNKS